MVIIEHTGDCYYDDAHITHSVDHRSGWYNYSSRELTFDTLLLPAGRTQHIENPALSGLFNRHAVIRRDARKACREYAQRIREKEQTMSEADKRIICTSVYLLSSVWRWLHLRFLIIRERPTDVNQYDLFQSALEHYRNHTSGDVSLLPLKAFTEGLDENIVQSIIYKTFDKTPHKLIVAV